MSQDYQSGKFTDRRTYSFGNFVFLVLRCAFADGKPSTVVLPKENQSDVLTLVMPGSGPFLRILHTFFGEGGGRRSGVGWHSNKSISKENDTITFKARCYFPRNAF